MLTNEYISFFAIPQVFKGWNLEYKGGGGGNVKGVGKLHNFWDNKTLWIGIGH
jgi:hypothetical protein